MPNGLRQPLITTERTPLTAGQSVPPTYVYHASRLRQHKQRIRQFQCCICATILAIFVLSLVISIAYTINKPTNSTDTNNTTDLNLTSPRLLLALPKNDVKLPNTLGPLSNDKLKIAEDAGTTALKDRDLYEASTKLKSLDENSPSFRHQKSVPTSNRARDLSRAGYASDYASKEVLKRYAANHTEWNFSQTPLNLNASWWPSSFCSYLNDKDQSTCIWNKYRSIDGSCNNVVHKNLWGVALTPFRRALPANYSDGVSVPRISLNGADLPSAREISVVVHRPIYRVDSNFTVMLAVWGQFMDHDITATALSQTANGTTISCCEAIETPGLKPHPECFTVPLSPADPYYSLFNISCMEFVRSAPAPTCTLGPREQMNQVSAYLDGSVVYSSDNTLMKQLRTMKNGLMRTFITPDNRSLLPISTDKNDGCNRAEMNEKGRYCFLSGDARANENLHLTTIHLLWVRQHNRIAQQLAKINPQWSDEILFQESRRIVAAQLQHITYNEFLPIILGTKISEENGLLSEQMDMYYKGYSDEIDASIANEFASSAFRFAHTFLPTLMRRLANDTSSNDYIEMHKILFDPYSLYNKGGMDSALRSAMFTNIEAVDPYFSKEFKQHLFERDSEMATFNQPKTILNKTAKVTPCGLDLVSLNIQRGRDHGLQPYVEWREFCGYSKPTSFEDLTGVIDPESLERIKSIYNDVNDIDLYTGALSEYPKDDSLIGGTATCLIVDQFVRLKRGDRYWYETDEKPQAFTIDQLNNIRQTTFARIICNNSDNITTIQPQVMLTSKSTENSFIPCSQLPDLDLQLWKTLPTVTLTASKSDRMSNLHVING